MSRAKLGVAGSIARFFQGSQLTPLLALIGVLLGIMAVVITPKEEEPQIDVTFANVFIAFPGASVKEVESLVTTPAEQVLSELEGVRHIYSVSSPGMSMLTVEFKVGVPRNDAILRLYNQVYSNADWLPQNLGVGHPLIKPMGIDDVPIVTLTLWSEQLEMGAFELQSIAHALEVELKRIPGTRALYTVGGVDSVLKVEFDPEALRAFGQDVSSLRRALQMSNQTTPQLARVMDGEAVYIQAGELLRQIEDVENLVIGTADGRPVYLSDVARVTRGPDLAQARVLHGGSKRALQPAVTLAITKQPGQNATDISKTVFKRVDSLRERLIPADVHLEVTRDYGLTAAQKARSLIINLISATVSVFFLLWFTLGRKQASIVGTGVVITLLIMLFASWVYGFTINRVSLFALIFSIGILVDDAIVVIENIHRHVVKGGRPLREIIPIAVDEVGGPTILSTFTVISALMPMAFVSGLMGPYMSPVPINATMGMIVSNIVAFVVIPWMALRMFKNDVPPPKEAQKATDQVSANNPEEITNSKGIEDAEVADCEIESDIELENSRLAKQFRRLLSPFLRGSAGRVPRLLLFVFILALIVGAVMLPVGQAVILKMLPFDNKSELQVMVDMPQSSTIEQTQQVLIELGAYLETVAEVDNYQLYAGTSAPINFNGLVRQYYLRSGDAVGDIQVNLKPANERKRSSHEIAQALRPPLQAIGLPFGANIKMVEVPPGPPVQAPIVAEIYGPDYAMQTEAAGHVRKLFNEVPGVVDVDDSIESPMTYWQYQIDRSRAARFGLSQQEIAAQIHAATLGENVTFLHEEHRKYPVPIRISLPAEERFDPHRVLEMSVINSSGQAVALSDLVKPVKKQMDNTIAHKDLLPVVYVTGDMSGESDSPLYGMFSIAGKMWGEMRQYFISDPELTDNMQVKWSGEWQITYETFRDMGLAYLIGILFIYFFVVVEFKSYWVPLIIMVPIPLTVVGVFPGHLLFGEQFTATSMIGMIALGGIIVRNSIILVDFIEATYKQGVPFQDAVIFSGAVRAKPIILTGGSTMLGAAFMLGDPIFGGLAVSLISGVFISTMLTLIVIPVLYYASFYRKKERERQHTQEAVV